MSSLWKTKRSPEARLCSLRCSKRGKLELFCAYTKELEYFAISHVWGKIQWLKVSCFNQEIKASPQKVRWIEQELPSLVGETAFWMDTLTVNQRDEKEVIATVQAVPAIFQDAADTSAVREDDGFGECCAEAIAGCEPRDLNDKLLVHMAKYNSTSLHDDSYLRRLWTLQECVLSHTIQFVVIHENPNQIGADEGQGDLIIVNGTAILSPTLPCACLRSSSTPRTKSRG